MSDESKPTEIPSDVPSDERETIVPPEPTGNAARRTAGVRVCVRCGSRFDAGEQFCARDGDPLVDDPLLLVGLTIGGGIRIDGLIGTGGMGVVYRATQLELDRLVAIKVVRGNFLGQQEIAARFRREAHAVARLRHPSIVTIHDFGTAPDIGTYIVMEYLEGRSLREELVARKRLSVGETVVLLRQICGALHTAHRAGVIHRDLKPENVFLERTDEGTRAKVLDFGIAKLLDASSHTDSRLTATGVFLGTPLYASPEQGLAQPLDGRTDIYSLGAIGYEALAGRPPFLADDVRTALRRHGSEVPAALRDLDANVPASLESAILRALSKDPDDRFPSALEFGQSLAAPDSSGDGTVPSVGRHDPSERRTLTILHAQFLAVTAGDAIDPEDWEHIVDGALDRFRRIVATHGATLADGGGDGMVAYFGTPVAHEDDAFRAAEAALGLLDEAGRYAAEVSALFGAGFAIRIGLNTGSVVVRAARHPEAGPRASGDAVTVASALASNAQPGTAVVGESTWHRIAPAFECEDLESIASPGRTTPVSMHRLAGPKSTADTAHASPFVGRTAELEALTKVTDGLDAGIGRIAVVVGEPGLGKSRLVDEWRLKDATGGVATRRWATALCRSSETGNPYQLVLDLLRSLLGLNATATDADRQRALEHAVADLSDQVRSEVSVHLGHILSIPSDTESRDRLDSLDPRRLRAKQAGALRSLLESLAARRPLVVVLEDLHWADASSVDLLVDVLPLAALAPIVFCLVARPETDADGWRIVSAARSVAGARLTDVSLVALSTDESRSLVANLAGAQSLPEMVLARVLDRAEGNPLFTEEVVRSLIECGAVVRNGDVWEVCDDETQLEIPATIQSLLLARIDRLSAESRRMLQVASVIGRRVRIRVLADVLAIVDMDEATIINTPVDGASTGGERLPAAALNSIEGSGLFQLAATRPELEYQFRHALVRETVYASLLKPDRRRLHGAVGDALERRADASDGRHAAELAYHFTRADAPEKALVHLQAAAEFASGRFAVAEAVAFYEAALQELERVSSSTSEPRLDGRAAAIREALGDLLLRGGDGERARVAFADAAESTSTPIDRARLGRKIGNAHVAAHDFERGLDAFAAAEALLEGGNETRDLAWWREWVQIHLDRVWLHYWTHDVDGIATLVEKSREAVLEYGDPVQRSGYLQALVLMAARRDGYVIDDDTMMAAEDAVAAADESGVSSVMIGAGFLVGFVRLFRGDAAIADRQLRSVLDEAVRTGERHIEARCLAYLLVLDRMAGRVQSVRAGIGRAWDVAASAQLPEYLGVIEAMRAWLALGDGDGAAAERFAAGAIAQWSVQPVSFPFQWIALIPLIEVRVDNGDVEEAMRAAVSLLDPRQMRLPDEVADPIARARDLDEGASAESRVALIREALDAAKRHGFR